MVSLTLKKLQRFLICSITNLISFEKTVVIQTCTKTRNSDTKRPKRNNWNKWNYRNDKNKTIERLFRFGSFASTLSLRLFRFGRFESLFRVLVHAWITTKIRNETAETKQRNETTVIVSFQSFCFGRFGSFACFSCFVSVVSFRRFGFLVHAGYLLSSDTKLDKLLSFNAPFFTSDRCTDRDVWITSKRPGVFLLWARPSRSPAVVKRLKEKQ